MLSLQANFTIMIILDKPYVSDLLVETIQKNKIGLLNTAFSSNFTIDKKQLITEEQAVIEFNSQQHPKIYTNSENAINWIANNLQQTELPSKINLFKDKVKFRKLIEEHYPKFFYTEIAFDKLETISIQDIPKPFIIKPSIGFFSMGVYKVENDNDWLSTVKSIQEEMSEVKSLYPLEVMDATNFIIEECIDGDEFAFDAYFNEAGEPVITGIFKHLFSSGKDVSDRVYYTSKALIEEHLENFTKFLTKIGKLAKLHNFPLHTEVRITEKGEIIPIEVNPMRFGGWCTTADATTHAFNLNSYEYYFNNTKPNWSELLKGKENLNYCIVILNNSTGYSAEQIENFDYEKMLSNFNKPLALRKVDWNTYPLFGILFTETHSDNYSEIENILTSTLRDFVHLDKKE